MSTLQGKVLLNWSVIHFKIAYSTPSVKDVDFLMSCLNNSHWKAGFLEPAFTLCTHPPIAPVTMIHFVYSQSYKSRNGLVIASFGHIFENSDCRVNSRQQLGDLSAVTGCH